MNLDKKKLAFDLMDELEPDDLSKNSRDVVVSDTGDSFIGAHQVWFHGTHFVTKVEIPTELDEKQLYFVEHLRNRAKYIDNIDFWCIDPSDGKTINILDQEESWDQSFNVQEMYMTFDYDEQHCSDIDYMLNVLEESCIVLLKFMKEITNFNLRRWHFSFNPDTETYYDNNDYIEDRTIKELYYSKIVDNPRCVINSLKTLGTVFEKESESVVALRDALDVRKGNNIYGYDSLIKVGCKPSLARRIKIVYMLSGDSDAEVTIPKDESISLKTLSLNMLKQESKLQHLYLIIKGTLLVNSLEELNNLQYLLKEEKHHNIVFNTFVSQKMLQHLIDNYHFDEINLMNAKSFNDKPICLNIHNAVNKDVNIVYDKSTSGRIFEVGDVA